MKSTYRCRSKGLSARPLAKDRTGAAAVEFAIAISILLMIVFASIEFVRLNILKQSVEHASYLAARRGMIVGSSAKDVQEIAIGHMNLLGIDNSTISVSPSKITDETQVVEVNIIVPTSGNTWISPVYFSGNITGRTRMLAERAAADMSNAIPTPAPPPPPPEDDD